MKALLIAMAMLTVLAIGSGVAAYDNEPSGFRGVEWGSSLDEVRHRVALVLNERVENNIAEYRSAVDLSMNGIPLHYNFYRFYKGRFYAGIMFTDFGRRQSMIETLTARFGPPSDGSAHETAWYGPKTMVLLVCAAWQKSCAATFESTAIVAELQNDRARRAKAGKDF